MNKLATILLFINFVTVLFPQPGYVHPDEFFQSTEIVAGDVLDVLHTRVWEFNTSSPVRNIVFPYLVSAPAFYLLKYLNSTNITGLKISAVKIVMATRLPVAFLSLFGFLATDRLSQTFKSNGYLSQVMWCSSYVTWTYFTRTFSNSIEAALLALVFLVALNNLSSMDVLRQERLKQPQKSKSKRDEKKRESEEKFALTQEDKEPKSDVKSEVGDLANGKSQCVSEGHSAFALGCLLIAGFFNRPTFPIFAFVPMLYWFVKVCALSQNLIASSLSIIIWASVGAFSGLLVFVGIDTWYYNPSLTSIILNTFEKIMDANYSLKSVWESFGAIRSSLVLTPWNFVTYNLDSENLADHGLHPHYMHFLVNLPLLLGPLFFPFIAVCMLSLVQLLSRHKMTENRKNSFWLVMMALVPVAGLSVFPHQEPRFLIPLLPIFIVLGAKLVSYMASGKKLFFIIWVVFNIILHLIYGYVHQAAIIPALSIYQQKLSSPKTVRKLVAAGTNHAFFYKTYPPPLHLLLLDPNQNHFKVHDLAGSPVRELVSQVRAIEKKRWMSKGKNQVFIFMPSTASKRVTDLLVDDLNEYGVKLSTTSICPHFSVENLPRFRQFWAKQLPFDDFIMDFCLNVVVIT